MTNGLPTVLLFANKKVMNASGPAATEIVGLVLAHERVRQPAIKIVGPLLNLANARSVVMWHSAPELVKDTKEVAYLELLRGSVEDSEKKLLDTLSRAKKLRSLEPHIAAHMVFCPSKIPSTVITRSPGTRAPIFCFRLLSPDSLHILSWDTAMVETASAMHDCLVRHVQSLQEDFTLPEPPEADSSSSQKKHKSGSDVSEGGSTRKKSRIACRR